MHQTRRRNGFWGRGKLVHARTRPGVFATNVPFSLQVSHHCLCSFHIYDVLSLYFTTRSSAQSREFQLLLPLKKGVFCTFESGYLHHCNQHIP